MTEFESWPKIARLNRDITVTEKIDGTNAAVIIGEDGTVAAQSRKRLITPDDDNYGFARWASDRAGVLYEALGPGRHFGEWWGAGIQRRYGLTGSDKRFSLFNTARYAEIGGQVDGLHCVPVLYEGPFGNFDQKWCLERLAAVGSVAAPGFENPEGIVVFHSAAQQMFKVTLQGDEQPKSQQVPAVLAAGFRRDPDAGLRERVEAVLARHWDWKAGRSLHAAVCDTLAEPIKDRECSSTCAPGLHLHCSAECEADCAGCTPAVPSCVHCRAEVTEAPGNSSEWVHTHGLSRCQSADVEYGHLAHPAGVPCPADGPNPCLGASR